ncbi:helix-turn-helix domain-containing protein [Streptomyces sp. SID5910]|uniref:helix-turn-helix transcriptional regulator n=1 Tax=Streptomyces sp. SID5910 TaxID=2690312 RepID=UPI001F3ED84A|nr:helix-turn-helix domain-containing protein [Streptomyces sp. SID5910]
MTTTEIAKEHGVSRQTIHTYRRTGIFPAPVEGEGSTRPRFREDQVDAFFEANPKQPRKKRRPQSEQQGEPVTATTARNRLTETLTSPGLVGLGAEEAAEMLDAYRAAVLRTAADELAEDDHLLAAEELRRMADEKPEAQDG